MPDSFCWLFTSLPSDRKRGGELWRPEEVSDGLLKKKRRG